jgi:hypothetical protein
MGKGYKFLVADLPSPVVAAAILEEDRADMVDMTDMAQKADMDPVVAGLLEAKVEESVYWVCPIARSVAGPLHPVEFPVEPDREPAAELALGP